MAAKINNEPLVSVIMTSYNYAHFISFAIESVLAQDYTNLELLIIDDGSTDNSLEIENEYGSKFHNINLLTHPNNENRGIAESLKLGINSAKGKIIAFLESDDVWLPQNLSEKVSLLINHPEIASVFSSIELAGEKISQKYHDYITYLEWAGRKLNKMKESQLNLILLRNPAATFSNLVFRTGALKNISIDSNFEKWLDWQLLIQATLAGRIGYINNKLIQWRIHSQSMHFIHMKKSGNNSLAEQREEFFKTIRLKMKIENSNNHVMKLNLEFAACHPIVTLRKIFNYYGSLVSGYFQTRQSKFNKIS
jgi:glycosyltransferase involved in cell wall biosynthesis